MKVRIEVEVSDQATFLQGTKSLPEALHEALCLNIHEGNEEANTWLAAHVMDVSIDQPTDPKITLTIKAPFAHLNYVETMMDKMDELNNPPTYKELVILGSETYEIYVEVTT